MRLLTLTLLAAVAGGAFGANILGLLPMPSRSHGILMERLMRELGNRGHHITYITASPPVQDPIPNMTLIHVKDVDKAMMRNTPGMNGGNMNMFEMKGSSPWFMFFFTLAGQHMCDHILSEPAVAQLIKSDQKFDLILAEAFLDESVVAGFAYKFQAPIVGVMSFMPNIWGNYLVGNPAPSSYIPDPNLGMSTHMTYCERLYNFLFTLAWDIHHPLIYLSSQDAMMKKHFGEDTPGIHGILRNTSLVLVNHHYALGFPRAYLPNMVEVGGMHINPVKPLPADLKKYLDESTRGVILFSLGSNLRSQDMPPQHIQSILKAFARLPYNILWKFEATLDNLPNNVKIGKWFPQSDILAHPKLKLFITHGGLLSTTEAVHRGVPVLGIPIFGDQPLNMKHTENAGLGKTLDFNAITEDSLFNTIIELTGNPKYGQAAKYKSSVLRDTMNTPLEKAVWWVEHVIKYRGAPHLHSAAQDLAFYQLHQLDVIATLAAALLAVAYVNLVILRAIVRKLFCKTCATKKAATKQKTKKNN